MARTYSKTALGERLARYRKAAGYTTVEALAAAIPGHWISKGTITNIEVGRKADITIQELIALSRAIGVTPLALVCDLEQPFSKYKEQSFADTNVTNEDVARWFNPSNQSDGDDDVMSWFESMCGKSISTPAEDVSGIWDEVEILRTCLNQAEVLLVEGTTSMNNGDAREGLQMINRSRSLFDNAMGSMSRLESMGVQVPESLKQRIGGGAYGVAANTDRNRDLEAETPDE